TEQCTLSADHEQNEKKLLCSIRACLTGDISMSKIKKPALACGLRRDTSLYIFISRLYHVSTKIRNGEH
ncbi:hypothetical protein, partial [Lactococcus lactis]